jgi:hypothetical protein
MVSPPPQPARATGADPGMLAENVRVGDGAGEKKPWPPGTHEKGPAPPALGKFALEGRENG